MLHLEIYSEIIKQLKTIPVDLRKRFNRCSEVHGTTETCFQLKRNRNRGVTEAGFFIFRRNVAGERQIKKSQISGEEPLRYRFDKSNGDFERTLVIETTKTKIDSGDDDGEGGLRR